MINTPCHSRIFDAYAHPYVFRPGEAQGHVFEAFSAFGEHLKGVLASRAHHVEYSKNKSFRDSLVEKVAHRIHKDRTGSPPGQGQSQHVLVNSRLKAIPIVRVAHSLEPHRHAFRVAIQTSGTDFRAAGHGIPAGFRPLDF